MNGVVMIVCLSLFNVNISRDRQFSWTEITNRGKQLLAVEKALLTRRKWITDTVVGLLKGRKWITNMVVGLLKGRKGITKSILLMDNWGY